LVDIETNCTKLSRLALLPLVAAVLAGCGSRSSDPPELARYAYDWPAPGQSLSGARAVPGGPITPRTVGRLAVRWRFRIPAQPRESGVLTATPLVGGDTVYVQDMLSNVYALDRASGALRWSHRFGAGTPGPNGLALGYGRVYGSTDSVAFALSATTGRLLWQRRLVSRFETFVDIAPVVANGLVYTATVGYTPGSRGALYGLDAHTGAIRWRFDTIRGPWRFPQEAGGGGAWAPAAVDGDGRVYFGTANPTPWGGSARRPNGGAFPGPALYTDSLLVLDGNDGKLLWYDQVTPHDVRDHDFQLTPILARERGKDVVLGAGKSGRVIAWDRGTHRRLWEASVGVHENDTGPLPARRVPVCPGLLGGVETPMAYARGRLFVPVVDLCSQGSATGYQDITTVDPTVGTGELVALDAANGRRLWRRRLPGPVFGCATAANGVVFTATFDGTVYAFDSATGATLWTTRARAGINACPAVAGDLLLVGAGSPYPGLAHPVYELVAYGLR
jgi:outer membrane protein assembly factor BamB